MGIFEKWGWGTESAKEVKEQRWHFAVGRAVTDTLSVCLPRGVEEPACCGRRLALLAHSLSLAL